MKGNLIFGIVAKNEPESAARLRCPLDKERAGLVSGAMHGLLALPRALAPRRAFLPTPFSRARRTSKISLVARFAEIYHAPGKVYPPPRPTAYPPDTTPRSQAPSRALLKNHAPRHAHPRWATRVPPHKSRAPTQRPSSPHNAYPYNKKRNARFWQAFRKCSSCNLIRRQSFQPFSFQ